ncbi:MAG: SHD1 domain-containing protein [Planctomycetota bacterium]
MKHLFFALAVASLLLAMGSLALARKWTTSDGKFTVEAELVSVADGKVKLRKAGNTVITVPVERLSPADREFLAALPAKEAKLSAKEASYVRDIKPILTKCCVDCHRQKKARGGYKFETYAELLKVGKKGAAVVPGDPAKSRVIVTHAHGKPHPPKDKQDKDDKDDKDDAKAKAPPPTADEMDKIEAWIKAGAPDDSAARP